MKASAALVMFFLLLSACAGARVRRETEMYENLRTLAASDLSCDAQEVTLIPVGGGAVDAVGCDQRVTYVGDQCTGSNKVASCTWSRGTTSP